MVYLDVWISCIHPILAGHTRFFTSDSVGYNKVSGLIYVVSWHLDIVYSTQIIWPYKLFTWLIAPLMAVARPVSPVHRVTWAVFLRVCRTRLPRVVITAQGIKDDI